MQTEREKLLNMLTGDRTVTTEKTYWVENAEGQTLTEQSCKGMGSKYSFCDEMADAYTLDEAARLSTIYGGMIVPTPSN